ncbi:unnamed protein product, partial [Rotaria magnacalcarata]
TQSLSANKKVDDDMFTENTYKNELSTISFEELAEQTPHTSTFSPSTQNRVD